MDRYDLSILAANYMAEADDQAFPAQADLDDNGRIERYDLELFINYLSGPATGGIQ